MKKKRGVYTKHKPVAMRVLCYRTASFLFLLTVRGGGGNHKDGYTFFYKFPFISQMDRVEDT